MNWGDIATQMATMKAAGHRSIALEKAVFFQSDAETFRSTLEFVRDFNPQNEVRSVAPGIEALYCHIVRASFLWAPNTEAGWLQLVLEDPWFQQNYADRGESFVFGELLSGSLSVRSLELLKPLEDESVQGCTVDNKPASGEFFVLDEHFDLAAMLRRGENGPEDEVWLLQRAQEPWIKPMNMTVKRYYECAWSVRGLRNWQLAALGDENTKRRIATVVPHCFPEAEIDPALR